MAKRRVCAAVAAAALLGVGGQQAEAAANVTYQRLAPITFPDDLFTRAYTNIVDLDAPQDPVALAQLGEAVERARDNVDKATAELAGGALGELKLLVETIRSGVEADPISEDLGAMLDQPEPGGSYRATFHYSAATPALPEGQYGRFRPGDPLRAGSDPATDQLLVVDFTAPISGRPSPLLFLLRRPDTASGFGLAGVNLQLLSAVPEPATWATLALGFGVAGAALRWQRAPSRRAGPGPRRGRTGSPPASP